MDLLDAISLGILEGVTEFLPISSTGHLILASKLLNINQSDFLKSFEISIQLGAILSVVVLYFKTFAKNLAVARRLLVAFIPTAVIGLIFYRIVKTYLLDSQATVLVALLLGGIFLIIFEKFHREKVNAIEKLEAISYRQSLLIGLFQSLAIVPGVSRAAATIIGGLTQNISRKTIVEFSFLLAVPTMLAATVLDLIQTAGNFGQDELGLLLAGFITSFIVAILAIKFLLHFIKTRDFTVFGLYRILIAIIFWFIMF